MRATTTSSTSSVVLAALRDEFEKIADDRNAKLKRYLKNAVIIAAGTGAGTGAMMVADKAISAAIGPSWAKVAPNTKKMILGPAIGLTSLGAAIAAQRLLEEQAKHE